MKFRKKPVVIEATQWFKDGDHPAVIRRTDLHWCGDEGVPWVPTLEGGHVVTPGDWIITGVKGEHYPCKPDIFAMTYEHESETAMTINDLPALGQPLDGGTFAGLTTTPDGAHVAVILLPGAGDKLTWAKAKAWAKKQGGELPSRPVAALLFANVKSALQPRWHWTSDEEDASSAWRCYFYGGDQYDDRKSYEGSAVAVRRVPIGDSNG